MVVELRPAFGQGGIEKSSHAGALARVEGAKDPDVHHLEEANGGAPSLGPMGTPRTPKGRAKVVAARLADEYPEAICELDHHTPFELLVATILSAQTTDARVNMVTPALFARYPDAGSLAAADPEELEDIVRSTGFYQSKARNLISMAQSLMDRFDGEVPTAREDLVTLAGVGRKTANVVRSVAFDLPGLPVDTHVGRLARRLGLTAAEDPVKVEAELGAMLPPAAWGDFSLRVILHGRRVCDAKRPRCAACVLENVCPSSLLPRQRERAT
ncbi:MAG: DNA-(apurinic or apyrimidinic site) lyase [Actinomycetota bacterium]